VWRLCIMVSGWSGMSLTSCCKRTVPSRGCTSIWKVLGKGLMRHETWDFRLQYNKRHDKINYFKGNWANYSVPKWEYHSSSVRRGVERSRIAGGWVQFTLIWLSWWHFFSFISINEFSNSLNRCNPDCIGSRDPRHSQSRVLYLSLRLLSTNRVQFVLYCPKLPYFLSTTNTFYYLDP